VRPLVARLATSQINSQRKDTPGAASGTGGVVPCDFRHNSGSSGARVLPIKHDFGHVFSTRR
jgi:hypothetical protein